MTILPTLRVGYDQGTSQATVYWEEEGLVYQRTIPSYVAHSNFGQMELLRTSVNAAAQKNDLVLHHEGVTYLLGDLAVENGDNRRGDPYRYQSGHTLRLLLALVGSIRPHAILDVVTAVPVGVFTKEHRKAIQESLRGTHTFDLNGESCQITINNVVVLAEGGAALFLYPSEEGRIGVIDIGGQTCDMFVRDGTQPVLERCKSIPIGIELAEERLVQRVKEQYGRILNRTETRQIMYAIAHGFPVKPVPYKEKNILLEQDARIVIDGTIDEILSHVARSWSAHGGKLAEDLQRIVLIGGGAYFAQKTFARHIPYRLIVPEHPEMANAMGCQVFALRLTPENWSAIGGS